MTEARSIVNLLSPYEASDDRTFGHDGARELHQDRALGAYALSCHLAKILDSGTVASIILSQQLRSDVVQRSRVKFHLLYGT